LEGGEGGQDGTSDPDRVLSLWRSNNLDLHGRRSKGSDFASHSVSDSRVHGGTTRQDNVSVQILSDIDVTLHDGVVGGFMDTRGFQTEEGRLEESLRSTESLITDGNNLTVRKFVGFLQLGGSSSGLEFLLIVESDVAELLLDVTNDFTLGGGGVGVTTLGEDLHEVVGQVTTSQVKTDDGVRKSITLIDGDSVGNTITRVEDDTGGTTGSIKGEDGLDGDVEGRGVESLKHDLGHLFTVGLWVERSLGEENRVLFRSHTEFIVEGVVPNLLHIVPVRNDSVLDGILQGEDTSLGLSFVADIRVLLAHSDHHPLVTGATDDGGKDSSGSVVSSKAGLAHTGTVINHESSNIVRHL